MVYQDFHPDESDSDLSSSTSDILPSSPVARISRESSVESELSSLSSSLSCLDLDCEKRARKADALEALVCSIVKLFKTLDALSDLKPSNEVNQLFNDLVCTCLVPENEALAEDVLKDSRIQKIIPRLRELCAIGETELERYWSRRIQEGLIAEPKFANFNQAFAEFPYYSNYEQITIVESQLVREALANGEKAPEYITFIGSGPLPLTSLLLAKYHFPDAKLTNIDINNEALVAAKSLSRHLCLSDRMQQVQADANQLPADTLACCEVVYLAALVGMNAEDKYKIIKPIVDQMWEGAILVVRSAHGLRSLLYPVLDVEALDLSSLRLKLVREWIPLDDEVVNSVLTFRKVPEWDAEVIEL